MHIQVDYLFVCHFLFFLRFPQKHFEKGMPKEIPYSMVHAIISIH